MSSEGLAAGLVFIVIATLACLAPAQSDTWWLLRAGLDTWQTGGLVLHDTYSHTAAGHFWPNHEWLTEVIFYGLTRVGGMPLLTGFSAALMTGTWILSWRLTKGPFEARLVLLVACVTAAAGSFALRPQAFSMALFVLTCALLAADRVWWLPLVILLWTNLHGAVALGIVAIVAALGATVLIERRLPKSLTAAALVCLLATGASPLGFGLWPEIAASLERSRINDLAEWHAPAVSPDVWAFWGVAILLPILAFVRRRRFDRRTIRLVAIALAVLPLAIRAVRNVHVFLLAGMPAVGALLHDADTRRRSVREHVRVNASILACAAVLAVAIVVMAWRAPAPRLGWRPMSGAAMEAVATCGEPMYNTYGDGGIIIWFVPGKRVFIDNRQDPYPMDLLQANRQLEFSGDYQPLFTQYGIRCAVVPPRSSMTSRLRNDPAWSLRYEDDRWTVFSWRQR